MKTKSRFYSVGITVGKTSPVPFGTSNKGSVVIQNVPFILKRITFAPLTFNHIASMAGTPGELLSDPYWLVDWRTDSHIYTSEPISIAAAWGGPFLLGPQWMDLPSPVEIAPKSTITFELTTQLERTDPTALQLVLAGVENAE